MDDDEAATLADGTAAGPAKPAGASAPEFECLGPLGEATYDAGGTGDCGWRSIAAGLAAAIGK